ncbi:MAG: hypothetical protein U0Z26_00765 [Anaerolineales bacterium]
MKQYKKLMQAITVVTVLALSAMIAMPALADDETPPPSSDVSAVDSQTGNVATEIAQSVSTTVTPEVAVVSVPSSEASNQLLSSDEVTAINSNDPIWCPTGVAPSPGNNGCTTTQLTFTNSGLISLIADKTVSGTIWIRNDYQGTSLNEVPSGVILNGASVGLGGLGSTSNYALTIKGGWTGTTAGTINSNDPSEFNVQLSIINWNSVVTLSDVLIKNVAIGSSNGAALEIQSTQSVFLNNVQVESSTGSGVDGAYINNNSSAAVGNVSITNSSFNNNNGSGLIVISDGVISLKDVNANGNLGGDGISLTNTASLINSGVSLTGATVAAGNGGKGLIVQSKGSITINNLVANGNTGLGADLDNSGAGLAAKAVTIVGVSNQFKYNTNGGLKITSAGAVTLSNITATNNSGSNQGVKVINLTSPVNSPVTISGTNIFNNNVGGGLYVQSTGIITTFNLTAKDNGSVGVFLQNNGVLDAKPVIVNVNGVNLFASNAGNGLQVLSKGVITVSNLTSSSNTGGMGALLNNLNSALPQNLTLLGTTTVNDNSDNGLSVLTNGVVLLGNIVANSNVNYGVKIDNATGSTLATSVTLSGKSNSFNDNTGDGLYILSKGAITLNNIQANGNTNLGVYLDNAQGSPVNGVTINGTSSFSNNYGTGLEIQTKGNILIANFTADNNNTNEGASGLYLDNYQLGAGTGNVTLGTLLANWSNSASGNYDSGIEIYSRGLVTLYNITTNNNGNVAGVTPYGYGLYIDNSTAASAKSVILNGSNKFDANYNAGLYILTNGFVTLNKVYADSNGDEGVYIDNRTLPATPQNVSIFGYGTYLNNGLSGLYVQSYGAVLLTNTYAESNSQYGVFVDNFNGDAIIRKGVTANGTIQAFTNGLDGIKIHSLGAILLNNLESSGNTGGDGVNLDNYENGTTSGITITGHAWANYNVSGNGISLTTLGSVLIYNLDVNGNGAYGACIDNMGGTSTSCIDPGLTDIDGVGTVTLLGIYNKAFSNQGDYGIGIYSNHSVAVANLDAENNTFTGVFIDNSNLGASLPQNVTITGINYFKANGDDGLRVNTFGTITTNNLNAIDNGADMGTSNPGTGYGVYLDNCLPVLSVCTAISQRSVNINGTNTFNGNYQQGLHVDSLGSIIASNLTANGNDGTSSPFTAGVYLFNKYIESISSAGVVLNGVNTFDNNLKSGLSILSFGTVTLNSLNANSNGDGTLTSSDRGAYIDVYNSFKVARVTITGTNNFTGNEGKGLWVKSNSSITINNLNASYNDEKGAVLDNFSGGSLPSSAITLTGTNVFNSNGSNGLDFETYGAVLISNITADGNDFTNLVNGSGIVGTSHNGAITITCGSMTHNGFYGWSLDAHTIITLKGVFSTLNSNANENKVNGTLVKINYCL